MNVPQAAAIGVCILARRLKASRTHPGKCRYCEVPVADLIEQLREYGVAMSVDGTVAVSQRVQNEEAEYRRHGAAERERRLREALALPEPQWFEEVA